MIALPDSVLANLIGNTGNGLLGFGDLARGGTDDGSCQLIRIAGALRGLSHGRNSVSGGSFRMLFERIFRFSAVCIGSRRSVSVAFHPGGSWCILPVKGDGPILGLTAFSRGDDLRVAFIFVHWDRICARFPATATLGQSPELNDRAHYRGVRIQKGLVDIAGAARPGLIVGIASTVAPSTMENLAARLADTGIVLLDTPLTRGEPAIAAGGASGERPVDQLSCRSSDVST
jgi:hypothetical protein